MDSKYTRVVFYSRGDRRVDWYKDFSRKGSSRRTLKLGLE